MDVFLNNTQSHILSSKLLSAQVKIAQIFHYFLHNLIVLAMHRSSHACLTASTQASLAIRKTRAVLSHARRLAGLGLPAA